MQCPIDGAELLMTERNGVEIDYCPKCRGVWLDRGELDKIIERANAEASPPPAAAYREDDRRGDDRRVYGDDRRVHEARPYKKSKSKSILGEIFDF